MSPLTLLWLALAGYLLGSIPFGFLVGKAKGIDIRQHGSGNIGATNVLRTLGKPLGITVFILDAGKGALAVALAKIFAPVSPIAAVLAAIACILGHSFTCWLKFKGGKGVATSAGVLLGMIPIPALITLGVWILVFYTTRYVSLGSILGAAAAPISAWALGVRGPILYFVVVAAVLVIARHKSNIQRLLAGTENRFERKKK